MVRSRFRAVLPLLALSLLVSALPVGADDSGLYRRKHRGQKPNYQANGRVRPSDWPSEPDAPSQIDEARFASALRDICGWMKPSTAAKLTGYLQKYGAEFGEDPFLLAAVMYHQSRCNTRFEDGDRLGLLGIDHRMHRATFKKRSYRYRKAGTEAPEVAKLKLDKFPFGGPRLLTSEANIYFGAALLSAWRKECPWLDQHVGQEKHRHAVSHFIWGDRVRSARDEDAIFDARRRLLEYYGARKPPTFVKKMVRWRAPVDGAPRVVSSGLGTDREGGARSHRGVDVETNPSEPVRAAAAGRVVFAGVDLPGSQHNEQLRKGQYAKYSRDALGRGGRYVCVKHEAEYRTCYMHLEEVHVEYGEQVEQGAVLGTVGRTGMKSSAAHLHFELYRGSELLDPRQFFSKVLIGDPFAPPRYPPSASDAPADDRRSSNAAKLDGKP